MSARKPTVAQRRRQAVVSAVALVVIALVVVRVLYRVLTRTDEFVAAGVDEGVARRVEAEALRSRLASPQEA